MTTPHRTRAITALLVGLVVSVGIIGVGPEATAQAQRCNAVPVVGMTVQQARQALMNSGCLPGNRHDGRHFAVNASSCFPGVPFGTIAVQSAFGRLGRHQLLIITKSIEPMGSNDQCDEVQPTPTQHTLADLDGTYDFTFTVTASSDPLVLVGRVVNGLQFTVNNGAMTGDIVGTIRWNPNQQGGTATGAQGALAGSVCTGTVTFAIDAQERVQVNGPNIRCDGGAFTGTVAGNRRPG